MPTAYNILPDRFADDRHGAIERGLGRAGFKVVKGFQQPRGPGDILVTWTVMRGGKETMARQFEGAGGRVLVCEEAYIRNVRGEKHFALALHDHSGAGTWPAGGPQRWESFGIELKPWRKAGEKILVTEQRSIGSSTVASPPGWHDDVAQRLRQITQRPVEVRWHPRSRIHKPPPSKEENIAALGDAWAVVTWNSAFGVRAVMEGVPVIYEAPRFTVEGAAGRWIKDIDAPAMPDRLPAFERLAWAQWSVSEIESGRAFGWLNSA